MIGRAVLFAVVSWVVSALTIAAWPTLVGSLNNTEEFGPLLLLGAGFAAGPIVLGVILLWNIRRHWFTPGSLHLVWCSVLIGGVVGSAVSLLSAPPSLVLAPPAAFAGLIGGTVGWAALRIAASSSKAGRRPTADR